MRPFYFVPRNVIFVGVDELRGELMNLFGETGGQSAMMHLRLAIAEVRHKDGYFPTMRNYMPREQREIIELVLATSRVRQIAVAELKHGNATLALAYNDYINSMLSSRHEHKSHAHDYVGRFPGESRGSGTPQLQWLADLSEVLKAHLIPIPEHLMPATT